MKYGIYYAFWEQEWDANYTHYIQKIARLGFDILEIGAHRITEYSQSQLAEIRRCAEEHNVILTAGIGLSADKNLSSSDPNIRQAGREFLQNTFAALEKLDITRIGGSLYSYWPIDYSKPVDKRGDWERSIAELHSVARSAAEHNVTLCLEVLNRFETYLLNTAEEGLSYIRELNEPNVKLMLDTFHMNIEEDSISGAIRAAGESLGHFHTGECNRRLPGKGRQPWREIGEALREINYTGAVVMEPFVKMGGTVGSDIKVWRDVSEGASESEMDNAAAAALSFLRYMFD